MIENAKFSGQYFYINLNIQADFQICISVPLNDVNWHNNDINWHNNAFKNN